MTGNPLSGNPLSGNPLSGNPLHRHRLVHLIGQLGYGGSERQLFLVLGHFDRERFENHVVVFNPSRHEVFDRALVERGIQVWQMPVERRGVRSRLAFLCRLLRGLQTSVVHSWSVHDNPYAGLAGALARVPVRWGSLRGSLMLEGFRSLSPLRRWLCLHGVQKLIVNSEALRQELLERRIASSRIGLLRNCVPSLVSDSPVSAGTADEQAEFAAFWSRLQAAGISKGDRLVATVGNLRAVKNHSLFVRAMSRVLPRQPAVKALIVGQELDQEPGMRRRLEAEIAEHGMADRILLSGFCPRVSSLLPRLELFCLTSDSEGMPNSILEAMAAGLPVVATRAGGVPELVADGETGILVARGDDESLTDAIERVLSERALRQRLGAEGRRRATSRFSCAAAAETLASMYLDALEGPAGALGL